MKAGRRSKRERDAGGTETDPVELCMENEFSCYLSADTLPNDVFQADPEALGMESGGRLARFSEYLPDPAEGRRRMAALLDRAAADPSDSFLPVLEHWCNVGWRDPENWPLFQRLARAMAAEIRAFG